MSMTNFDIIEYQKRVIADLTAENKALKEQIEELSRLKAELKQAQNRLHDSMEYIPKKCNVCNIVKAMERIIGNGKEQKN